MGGKGSDIVIGIFVVAIAALFLVNVPPSILDFLIVFNLGGSVLLLLVVLFVPEPGKLYSFPALLLVSTLFRLGLNVASTRSILLNGYAGEVIQSFGQFLIRGEVIVGVVIFSIITVVNYIVVAKGASRVAEVAARFTLDGLPVKQMAIESDMRAGLLTNQEAMIRREELRRESQLYGSMDGAMKFVQGDVIAGIIIIFTNILGGFYVGLQGGMSWSDAVHAYTTLTVGDGLVSQIPSLLTAFCSGIVVTRVASGTGQTLGAEIMEQIMGRKEAWVVSGVIMLLISVVPGPPFLPFALGGTVFIIFAYLLPKHIAATTSGSGMQPYSALSGSTARLALPQPTQRSGELNSNKYILELDSQLFREVFQKDDSTWQQIWLTVKDRVLKQNGLRLPAISVRLASDKPFGHFALLREEKNLFISKMQPDAVFIEMHPSTSALFGIKAIAIQKDPLTGILGCWVASNSLVDSICTAGYVAQYTQVEFIALSCAGHFVTNPEEVISLADCFVLVKGLNAQDPGLVGHVIDGGLISVPRLTQLLQELAREGLHVGDVRSILEDIAGFYTTFDQAAEVSCTVDELVEAVRARRQRELIERVMSVRGAIRIVSLGDALKSEIDQVLRRGDSAQFLKNRTAVQKSLRKYDEMIEGIRTRGLYPFGILCEPEERRILCGLLNRRADRIPIVSSAEIDSQQLIEEIGVWDL